MICLKKLFSKSMKICIIATSYPNVDGIGNTFVEQLVNEFARQGNICTVISPLNIYYDSKKTLLYKEYEEKIIDGKYKVYVYRPRTNVWNIPLIPISTTRHAAQKAIERTIDELNDKFDCIYCHFFASGILAWHYAHKHKLPLFVATGESRIPGKFQFPCFSFSWKKFKRDTNGVVCVSSKNYDECIELGYADKIKCQVFPNGVNLSEYYRMDKRICRVDLGFDESDFILTMVGEISDRKGQKRVIDALDKLQDNQIKLVVIGRGDELPQRPFLMNIGKVPHHQIPIYLNASDAFILPTLREGCCNAIVEAMACGLPIISSDRKFNYDILNTENSIMVDPEDVDKIAGAISALYQDRDLTNKLAEGAFTKAQTLDISRRAKNILSFIQYQIKNV